MLRFLFFRMMIVLRKSYLFMNKESAKWRDNIKVAIKAKGYTQQKFAEQRGVTQGGLSHWLNGRREMTVGEFSEMCDTLKVSPSQILESKNTGRNLIDKSLLEQAIEKSLSYTRGKKVADLDIEDLSKTILALYASELLGTDAMEELSKLK